MRARLLIVWLSALAAFVDAVGLMGLGGWFAAVMSGTTTLGAVGLAEHGLSRETLLPFSLVAAFLAGAVTGALVALHWPRWRQALVPALVGGVIMLSRLWFGHGGGALGAITILAFAMGMINMSFAEGGARGGGKVPAISYATGRLGAVGLGMAVALRGGDRWGWLWPLVMWSALLTGALLGGVLYHRWGLDALWIAVCASYAGAAFGLWIGVQAHPLPAL